MMKQLKCAMIFLPAIFILLASCGAGGGAMNGITPGVAIANGTEKHVIAPPTTQEVGRFDVRRVGVALVVRAGFVDHADLGASSGTLDRENRSDPVSRNLR